MQVDVVVGGAVLDGLFQRRHQLAHQEHRGAQHVLCLCLLQQLGETRPFTADFVCSTSTWGDTSTSKLPDSCGCDVGAGVADAVGDELAQVLHVAMRV